MSEYKDSQDQAKSGQENHYGSSMKFAGFYEPGLVIQAGRMSMALAVMEATLESPVIN